MSSGRIYSSSRNVFNYKTPQVSSAKNPNRSILVFDGVSGTYIRSTKAFIDDNGNITTLGSINASTVDVGDNIQATEIQTSKIIDDSGTGILFESLNIKDSTITSNTAGKHLRIILGTNDFNLTGNNLNLTTEYADINLTAPSGGVSIASPKLRVPLYMYNPASGGVITLAVGDNTGVISGGSLKLYSNTSSTNPGAVGVIFDTRSANPGFFIDGYNGTTNTRFVSVSSTGAILLSASLNLGTSSISCGSISCGAITSSGALSVGSNIITCGAITSTSGTLNLGSNRITCGDIGIGGLLYNETASTKIQIGKSSNNGGIAGAYLEMYGNGTGNTATSGLARFVTDARSSALNAFDVLKYDGTAYTTILRLTSAGVLTIPGLTVGTSSVLLGGNFATTGTFSSGGSFSTGSTFTTTGTFSSGGSFSTGSTFTTVGTFSSGGSFSTAGAVTIAGAFSSKLNITDTTEVTLPTSGTLATLGGTEEFTNKTISETTNSIHAGALKAGALDTARLPAFTGGDVTSSAGSASLSIGDSRVTLTKMANLTALTLIGNNTNASGTPTALDAGAVKTMLGLIQSDIGGLTTTSDVTFKSIKATSQSQLGDLQIGNLLFNPGANATSKLVVGCCNSSAAQTGAIAEFHSNAFSDTAKSGSIMFITDSRGASSTNSILIDSYNGAYSRLLTLTNTGNLTIAGSLTTGSSTLSLAGNLTTSGAYGVTLIATNATSVTLPTTGVLATREGEETFKNKTLSDTNSIKADIVNSGTLPVAQLPAFTGGDVTSSAGSASLSIGASKVTLGMMANLTGKRLIGNNTDDSGTPTALDAGAVKTMLAIQQSDISNMTTTSDVEFKSITATSRSRLGDLQIGSLLFNPGENANTKLVVGCCTSSATQTGAIAEFHSNTFSETTKSGSIMIITDSRGASSTNSILIDSYNGTVYSRLLTLTKTGGLTIAGSLTTGSSTLSLAGSLTTSGAYAVTLTTTNTTSVTLPTTGTLATLDGTETLTKKTLDNTCSVAATALTGTINSGRMPALTGDVAMTSGTTQTSISNLALSKLVSISNNTILGNNIGSSGPPIALSSSEVRALLGLSTTSTVQFGTVTASLSGNANTASTVGTTNLGKTGNVVSTAFGTNSQAAYSNLPVGFASLVSPSAEGMPNTSTNHYLFKLGNRDSEGGWAGLALGAFGGTLSFGRTSSSANYATWTQLIDATSIQYMNNKLFDSGNTFGGTGNDRIKFTNNIIEPWSSNANSDVILRSKGTGSIKLESDIQVYKNINSTESVTIAKALTVNGLTTFDCSVAFTIVTTSVSYAVTQTTETTVAKDCVIISRTDISSPSGNITITLPPLANTAGRLIIIKNMAVTGRQTVINTSSSEKIDNQVTSYTMATSYQVVRLIAFSNVSWLII